MDERLRNAVASELHAQLAMRGETITLADVCGVADAVAVAVRLGREFLIEEAPPPGGGLVDDDSLGPDGAAFYGSAMPAEDGAEASDRYPIFDYGWPARG